MQARLYKGELKLRRLDGPARTRALEITAGYLELARAWIGRSQETFTRACADLPVHPRDRKLAAGLLKLVRDRCSFEPPERVDPVELRREVFLLAARLQRDLDPGDGLDRERVLARVASARGITCQELEGLLYADLKSQHLLREQRDIDASGLVQEYEIAQAQAVLLKALRVRLDLRCSSPQTCRAFFHKLKFLGLLHTIEAIDEPEGTAGGGPLPGPAGYRIHIDGPYSLFSSVTRYGLKLALLLPALMACDQWSLEADLRWGKGRAPAIFRLPGAPDQDAGPPRSSGTPQLRDDVAELKTRFEALDTPWRVSVATEILDLSGVGLCIPDLRFDHSKSGTLAYLEVMGFWSRDAVWKRVDLVQAGLHHRVLFAVSSRLRVSEEVLGPEQPSALYVYKGTLSARAIAKRLDCLIRE